MNSVDVDASAVSVLKQMFGRKLVEESADADPRPPMPEPGSGVDFLADWRRSENGRHQAARLLGSLVGADMDAEALDAFRDAFNFSLVQQSLNPGNRTLTTRHAVELVLGIAAGQRAVFDAKLAELSNRIAQLESEKTTNRRARGNKE